MKKAIVVSEVTGEGLVKLLEEYVLIFALNYIYTGKLKGVNTDDILLEDVKIVYETGAFYDANFKDAQLIAKEHYIRTSSIESYGVTPKR